MRACRTARRAFMKAYRQKRQRLDAGRSAGGTPGKMACGLKIIRSDGSALSYGRAIGRYFATMLSSFTLGIGYLMVAFDDEKRALHDRVADTRVIYKDS